MSQAASAAQAAAPEGGDVTGRINPGRAGAAELVNYNPHVNGQAGGLCASSVLRSKPMPAITASAWTHMPSVHNTAPAVTRGHTDAKPNGDAIFPVPRGEPCREFGRQRTPHGLETGLDDRHHAAPCHG